MLDVARNWIGQLKRSSSSASSKPIEYMVWSYYVDYYKKIIDLAKKLGSVLAWAFRILSACLFATQYTCPGYHAMNSTENSNFILP